MASAKDTAERMKRDYEDKQRHLHKSAERQDALWAGVPLAWDALERELNDFKNAMMPLADHLQWEAS
jgi:hypothetical protein